MCERERDSLVGWRWSGQSVAAEGGGGDMGDISIVGLEDEPE